MKLFSKENINNSKIKKYSDLKILTQENLF